MPMVSLPGEGNRKMRAYLSLPEGEGPHAGVLVFHEAFGLNTDIRGKADRMAGMGYAALAPDLYAGRGPQPLCLMRVFREMGRGTGQAFDDIEAWRRWLGERPEVDAGRMGAIGFCQGGGFALMLAVRAPLGAAAVFYGSVPKDAAALEGVCPIVGGYGGRDRIFSSHGERLEKHLGSLGVDHDVVVYGDAGHSYMSDHHGVLARLNSWGPMRLGFRPEDAEDSWRRVEAFFEARVKS